MDAPVQPSKRRRLPSVSPVKRWQVAVSKLDFDGVESHSLFDSPSNRKRGLKVNDALLSRFVSNLRVRQLLFRSINVLYAFADLNS